MPTANTRPPILPRLFLQQAAIAMEETLQRKDFKGDWLAEDLPGLLDLLSREFDELYVEIRHLGVDLSEDDRDPECIRAEALDVALSALFIWHAAGGSNTVNRGREVLHDR